MRFIVRNYRIKPKKLKDPSVILEWETIATTQNKSLIKSVNYADPYDTPDGRRSRVVDVLDTWYYGKCAYCEKGCKADVEHYRPAKAVKDLNNQNVPGHDGYYWLCYEWTNMLPSCPNCNREGAKHNKFTVLNTYRTSPKIKRNGSLNKSRCKTSNPFLTFEQPVLLNPEIDNPLIFFEFEIDPNNQGVRIVGIDVNNRGRDTINICLLNRQELITERHKQVVLEFVDSIHCAFTSRNRNITDDIQLIAEVNQIIQGLYNKSRNKRLSFTLLRQFIVTSVPNFQRIIIPYIQQKLRVTVLTAFRNYTPY